MGYAKKLREMGIRAHAFNPYIPILSAASITATTASF